MPFKNSISGDVGWNRFQWQQKSRSSLLFLVKWLYCNFPSELSLELVNLVSERYRFIFAYNAWWPLIHHSFVLPTFKFTRPKSACVCVLHMKYTYWCVSKDMIFMEDNRRHCKEDPIYGIPRNETARPRSQFPYSCICERFIYSRGRAVSFLGIIVSNFGYCVFAVAQQGCYTSVSVPTAIPSWVCFSKIKTLCFYTDKQLAERE